MSLSSKINKNTNTLKLFKTVHVKASSGIQRSLLRAQVNWICQRFKAGAFKSKNKGFSATKSNRSIYKDDLDMSREDTHFQNLEYSTDSFHSISKNPGGPPSFPGVPAKPGHATLDNFDPTEPTKTQKSALTADTIRSLRHQLKVIEKNTKKSFKVPKEYLHKKKDTQYPLAENVWSVLDSILMGLILRFFSKTRNEILDDLSKSDKAQSVCFWCPA